MIKSIQNRFSAKLILLISLVFLIPVITALVTINLTSSQSLKRFDQALAEAEKAEQLGKKVEPGFKILLNLRR